MNKKWLNNKTIVITGASSGIGKQLTKLFITKNNCKVIGIARNKQKMEALVLELGDYAKNFEYKLFDVGIEQNWIDFANSLTEPVHLLINNAGIFTKFDNFLSIGIQKGKQVMDINYYSVVYGCNYLIKKVDAGIVNICSSDALLPVAGTNYYSASKHAVKGFTLSIASEFKNKYIGCILPGFTDTDIFRDIDFTTKETKLLKRFISPCDKISKKIYKAIIKQKRYKVIGYDAKLFNLLSKMNISGGTRLVNGVLQKTKLNMFSTIVDKN